MVQWSQPPLFRGALERVSFNAYYTYNHGWRGTVQVKHEGEDSFEVARIVDAPTESVQTLVRALATYLQAEG